MPGRMKVSVGAVPWEAKGLVGTTGAFMREGTLPVFTAGVGLVFIGPLPVFTAGVSLVFFGTLTVFTAGVGLVLFRAYAATYGLT